LAAECAERWSLELEPPSAASNASLVIPAGDAILKLNPPDEESEHEADALAAWDGDGAVRLLAHDRERRALLIERCRPGTTLWELEDDRAGDVVASLLPRLWKPPLPQYRLLADVAARWVDELPDKWVLHGCPFERRLLDETVSALRELGPSQGILVTANEDLHAGNVLRAAREPWLVIDPKPIAAERDFTLVSMVRDRPQDVLTGERPSKRLARRLDLLATSLELDRERLRRWTIAHTIAWGFDPDGFLPGHAAIARLLLDA
jgi:streptomycin 6-kinase